MKNTRGDALFTYLCIKRTRGLGGLSRVPRFRDTPGHIPRFASFAISALVILAQELSLSLRRSRCVWDARLPVRPRKLATFAL